MAPKQKSGIAVGLRAGHVRPPLLIFHLSVYSTPNLHSAMHAQLSHTPQENLRMAILITSCHVSDTDEQKSIHQSTSIN